MMNAIKNDKFLRALSRQSTTETPVWLMRQAGRYLPEYRALRAKAGSFMDLMTNSDYATEATLQPLERYDLDAAIIFADILTVPDAMGLGLSFTPDEGPRFARPLRTELDINSLPPFDLTKLDYVFSTIRKARCALTKDNLQEVPLIGFAGSPWTLACYMIEGGKSQDFHTIKTMLYSRSDLLHKILAANTAAVGLYLKAQIEAGVQAVMIFDSWGGVLADQAYQAFSLHYIQKVIRQLNADQLHRINHEKIPIILFTKGGAIWITDIIANKDCTPSAIGLDWTANLTKARELAGHVCALQGNLDPAVLLSSKSVISSEVLKILKAYVASYDFGKSNSAITNSIGPLDGYIFNLGHGISKHTPPDNVSHLIEEVRRYSDLLRK